MTFQAGDSQSSMAGRKAGNSHPVSQLLPTLASSGAVVEVSGKFSGLFR